jgi:hypothetical protein
MKDREHRDKVSIPDVSLPTESDLRLGTRLLNRWYYVFKVLFNKRFKILFNKRKKQCKGPLLQRFV